MDGESLGHNRFLAKRLNHRHPSDGIRLSRCQIGGDVREFGAAPRIRGSLHFGPVIIGEIGDVKRAIVFNGDVMNTAARLEELSRNVDGGFLASRAAMERFGSVPPFAVRDLGRLPIRGRADGIDVFGIGAQIFA